MDLTLNRHYFEASGIFGELRSSFELVAYVLEHAYLQPDGTYLPKVPAGIYTCQRSQHRLHRMIKDFETFQIMDVPGHSNILFHWGNYNADSDGCLLVGEAIAACQNGKMITNSKAEFARLMTLQNGVESFNLTVIS